MSLLALFLAFLGQRKAKGVVVLPPMPAPQTQQAPPPKPPPPVSTSAPSASAPPAAPKPAPPPSSSPGAFGSMITPGFVKSSAPLPTGYIRVPVIHAPSDIATWEFDVSPKLDAWEWTKHTSKPYIVRKEPQPGGGIAPMLYGQPAAPPTFFKPRGG